MQSKLLTSLREGLAAIRMAEYLNKILASRGEAVEPTGCILLLKTGQQSTISGTGDIFQRFKQTGEVKEYCADVQEPVSFYDDNFDRAHYRFLTFDQTFYKMPYDCRKSMFIYCT